MTSYDVEFGCVRMVAKGVLPKAEFPAVHSWTTLSFKRKVLLSHVPQLDFCYSFTAGEKVWRSSEVHYSIEENKFEVSLSAGEDELQSLQDVFAYALKMSEAGWEADLQLTQKIMGMAKKQ